MTTNYSGPWLWHKVGGKKIYLKGKGGENDRNAQYIPLPCSPGGGEDVEMERALALSQEAVASPQQAQV